MTADRAWLRELRAVAVAPGSAAHWRNRYGDEVRADLPALLDALGEAEKALRKVPLPQTSDPEVFWHAYEAACEALARMGEK